MTGAPEAVRGFTLIELIVVLMIIGIAAAVAVPAVANLDAVGDPAERTAGELVKILQSGRRAAMERGVPVVLTVDARTGRYVAEVEGRQEGRGDEESEREIAVGALDLSPEVTISRAEGAGPSGALRFRFTSLGLGEGWTWRLRDPKLLSA